MRTIAWILAGSLVACGPPADQTPPASEGLVAEQDAGEPTHGHLVNKVWRVSAPAGRPPGSFYVFLSNGMLIMTSCVETYRLAQWTLDAAGSLTITEDPITRYGADIVRLDERSLALRLKLRNETVDLALDLVDTPTVCPDLPR